MVRYFLVFLLLFIVADSTAQVTTNTPYSIQGLGIWEEPIDAITMGRGGARIAGNDSTYANDYNPASLSFLGKGMPLFSFDLSSRFSNFESDFGKSSSRLLYLKSIQIAIPFAKRFGAAVGIRPAISRGYDFKTYQVIAGDSIRHSYTGEGGVQQFYFSFSGAILKNEKSFLSVGLEGAYNFGNTANLRRSEFINSSSYFNGLYRVNDRVRGMTMRAGLTYQYAINKHSSFSVAAVYQPKMSLTTLNSESLIRFTGDYQLAPANIDTIFDTGLLNGKVDIPQRIGIGVNYEIRARQDSLMKTMNLYRLRFMVDIEHMAWSTYEKRIDGTPVPETFSDALFLRGGIEYTPHHKVLDKAPNISYFSKMTYRIGVSYAQLPQGNSRVTDFGTTFGLSFPIPFNRSLSSLNLGAKLGRQGEMGANSIRESYVGVHFGIILSPGFNDKWFRKFKYD